MLRKTERRPLRRTAIRRSILKKCIGSFVVRALIQPKCPARSYMKTPYVIIVT